MKNKIFVPKSIKNSKAVKDKKNRICKSEFFGLIKYEKNNNEDQCCEISKGIIFKRNKILINTK